MTGPMAEIGQDEWRTPWPQQQEGETHVQRPWGRGLRACWKGCRQARGDSSVGPGGCHLLRRGVYSGRVQSDLFYSFTNMWR